MCDFQSRLSYMQAFPLLGPLIVSPIKAVISCAEIVAGVACTIIFGTISLISLFQLSWSRRGIIDGIGHVGLGSLGFIASVLNIATLGISGVVYNMSECIWTVIDVATLGIPKAVCRKIVVGFV